MTPQGVLLGILGRGVPPGSPNPDPISDEKMSYFLHPFSDLGPVSRNMVKFNPGLSQISSTVFSSRNMQLEVTKNVEPLIRDK